MVAWSGVDTSDGPIDTEHVVLTGGPKLAEVGTTAGARIPAGGARHQVVVTAPVAALDVHEVPMAFDLTSGIYWRPGEAGGLLWGMSNPDEAPGVAAEFDTVYYQKARDRIEELFPGVAGLGLRRAWAATIDYTPDHLPILGPLLTDDGPVEGTVVACAAGHGMMWGPAVAEVAADLTTRASAAGSTSPTSVSTGSTPRATVAWPPSRSRCRSRACARERSPRTGRCNTADLSTSIRRRRGRLSARRYRGRGDIEALAYAN